MPMDMKAKIGETLSQLLCRKPLDKITVKELVDTCGISRQTFYYHFQDIMDVVEWNQRQSLRQAIEASLAAPTGRDAIRGIVSESVKRREQIRQLLSSQRGREIEQLVGMMLTGLENKHLDEDLLTDQMLRLLSGEISLHPADAGADGAK